MCPKDPNAKTGVDMKEEIERLDALKKKKNNNIMGVEINQKIMLKLQERGVDPFVFDSVSEERESIEDDDENAQTHKSFFIDIMNIKKAIEFDLDRVNII